MISSNPDNQPHDEAGWLAKSAAEPHSLIAVLTPLIGGQCGCCDCPGDEPVHLCITPCTCPAVRVARLYLGGKCVVDGIRCCTEHLPALRRIIGIGIGIGNDPGKGSDDA